MSAGAGRAGALPAAWPCRLAERESPLSAIPEVYPPDTSLPPPPTCRPQRPTACETSARAPAATGLQAEIDPHVRECLSALDGEIARDFSHLSDAAKRLDLKKKYGVKRKRDVFEEDGIALRKQPIETTPDWWKLVHRTQMGRWAEPSAERCGGRECGCGKQELPASQRARRPASQPGSQPGSQPASQAASRPASQPASQQQQEQQQQCRWRQQQQQQLRRRRRRRQQQRFWRRRRRRWQQLQEQQRLGRREACSGASRVRGEGKRAGGWGG